MSRKRKRKQGQNQIIPPVKKQRRYVVPLSEWQQFELFKSNQHEIEVLIGRIQTEWEQNGYYSPSLFELVKKFHKLFPNKKTYKDAVGYKPPKGSGFAQVAEILIQEIHEDI